MLSSASPPFLWQVRHFCAPTLAQTSSSKEVVHGRGAPRTTGRAGFVVAADGREGADSGDRGEQQNANTLKHAGLKARGSATI